MNGQDRRTGWLMALPALAGLFLFLVLPFSIGLVLSFTFYKLDSPLPIRFAGLAQYMRLFQDPGFLRALLNNLLFAAGVVTLQTAAALGLALLVNQPLRGRKFAKTLFFLPVVFPMALVAVVWELMYAPSPQGLLNHLLSVLSLGRIPTLDVLHDEILALPALMVMSIWQGVGFQMVILLAGLQGIPQSLYDAAALDGAGACQRFRHITLPQLANPLAFTVLATAILAFRLFDQVWILTQGGPRLATTTVIFEMVRSVFARQDVAYGSAMSIVFFLLVLTVTLLLQRFFGQERKEMS